MKNNFFFLLILVFLFSAASYSQTFDDYVKKKRQNKNFNGKRKEFDDYHNKKQIEFQKYLEEKWREFDVFSGKNFYKKPKPPAVPKYTPKPLRKPARQIPKLPSKGNNVSVQDDDIGNPEIIPPGPGNNKMENPTFPDENTLPDNSNINVAFKIFNTDVYLNQKNFIPPDAPDNYSGKSFAAWWKNACKTNYQTLINQLLYNKTKLSLNDYGYLKLVEKTSKEITTSENQQILTQWFLLVNSGYDVRLAYIKNRISLFVPVKQQLFSVPFIVIDGKTFYLFNKLNTNTIKTYEKAGPGKKVMDFDLYSPLNLEHNVESRGISFVYNLKTYYFQLNYNPNWVEFFKNYPQGELELYFDASVSDEFKTNTLKNLTPVVGKMSKLEAVNFLLRYVQKGFEYKTDQQQFGYEKFFFPEETLYYPYADCEDRAIYFAWLVTNLLNLEVVGLEYDGHVATAVAIPGKVNGDYLVFRGKKFTVADPTYIGAPVGLSMPQYENASPRIVVLKKDNFNNPYK